jgi:nucleoside-diphosphate-sugar epimerase
MAILITGAGLVGSQIARLEQDRGNNPVLMDIAFQTAALAKFFDINRVRLFEGDVLNPLDLARVIKEEKITRVIHTAAYLMLTIGAQQKPYPAIQMNIMGTVNILEAARIFELERVVFCSSNVLYLHMIGGEDRGAELKEEAYPRPASIYASTKQACENLGLNYTWFGVDFVAVRFSAIFGPWRGPGGGGGPSHLFREMLEKSLHGEESTFHKRTLEWVYSKDAAQGAVKACHTEGLKSRVFNISMGEVYDGQEVANIVKRLIPGAKVNLIEPPKDIGPSPKEIREAFDLTRSRSELGYEPEYKMQEAIQDYIKFLTTG